MVCVTWASEWEPPQGDYLESTLWRHRGRKTKDTSVYGNGSLEGENGMEAGVWGYERVRFTLPAPGHYC